MYRDIRSLARRLRDACETGAPCHAVFLGAGASLASGSLTTRQALNKILSEAGVDAPETMSDVDRISAFFDLVDQASEEERYKLTVRYQSQAAPPSGYKHLARLVAEGYFRTIITTSFDTFLEDALYDAGLRANDLLILDASYDTIPSRRRAPQVRLVKLHGDPYSAEFLSMVGDVELPPVMEDLLNKEMAGALLMVGYHPRDGVINTFLEEGMGDTWYVNPDEPGPDHPLASVLSQRGATTIAGDAGYPDRFFGELADLLLYRGVRIEVAQTVDVVEGGGSVVGVTIGKIGDSAVQVEDRRRIEVSELEDPVKWGGAIIGEASDALAEEEEDDKAALIASLERQREALQYDYWKVEKEVARYGLQAPVAVLNERESIRREIARLDQETQSLSPEVE